MPQTKSKVQFNLLMQMRQGVLFAVFELVYIPYTILVLCDKDYVKIFT